MDAETYDNLMDRPRLRLVMNAAKQRDQSRFLSFIERHDYTLTADQKADLAVMAYNEEALFLGEPDWMGSFRGVR